MKNIYLLKTDTPSRLYKNISGELSFTDITFEQGNGYNTNQHVYITSKEEIKVGDWYYLPRTSSVYKCNEDATELNLEKRLGVGKIILTTDPDLIADGVQSIENEFLEWFIMNIDCNKVDVDLVPVNEFGSEITVNGYGFDKFIYKIIIPNSDMKNPKKEQVNEAPEQVDENQRNLYFKKQVMNPYPVEQLSYSVYEKGFTEGYQEAVKQYKKLNQETFGYICPQTKKQCDDECCISAKDCHLEASIGVLSESKQETLEQAAKNWITKNSGIKSLLTPEFVRETFKEGAKWQQEQDSKELAMWKLTVEKQEAKCKELRGIISDLQERSISREAYEDSLSMQKCSNAGYESKITELQEGSYSEEEVYNLLYQLLPDKQELNEWFSQNKKK